MVGRPLVREYSKGIDFEKPEAGTRAYTSFKVDHGRIERQKHAVTRDVGSKLNIRKRLKKLAWSEDYFEHLL